MPQLTDPWASIDHDPTSNTEAVAATREISTTAHTLAKARADIHAAVAAHDDPSRRRQYAQSALDYANTVLTAADATDEQLRYARYYQDDARWR